MKFATIREFRSNASEIFSSMEKEGEIIVTKRGKPIAMLLHLSEEEFTDTIRLVRQIHFQRTLRSLRDKAKTAGTDKMIMEEINAEIQTTRKQRKNKASA